MRFRRVASTALVVTTVIGVAAPAVAGDDPREKKRTVDAHVKVLRSQVQASAAQVVTASAALEAANAKLTAAQARLAGAQQEVFREYLQSS